MKRAFLILLAAAALAALLCGCLQTAAAPIAADPKPWDPAQPVAKTMHVYKTYGSDLRLTLAQAVCLVEPGSTTPLSPSLNKTVPGDITYTVEDPAIAQVDPQGRVTGLSHGITTVTATLPGGHRAACQVEVVTLADSLTLPERKTKLRPGTTKALALTVEPADCTEVLTWTSSDPSIATVDETGLVTGIDHGTVTITCTAASSGISAQTQVKVCDLKQIALTFDDGPSRGVTTAVLDLLASYDIQATFFMVGENITPCASVVRRMVEEGHDLGYHTWTHRNLTRMKPQAILEDLELFQNTLYEVCGEKATFFRATYGDFTKEILQIIPLPHIEWTVDTRDWENQDAELIKDSILKNLRDGYIILMHDIRDPTFVGLKMALKQIYRRDLDVEFVTVTELLSRNGTPPEAGKTYRKG